MLTEDICGKAGKRSAVPLSLNSIEYKGLETLKKEKNVDVDRNKSLNKIFKLADQLKVGYLGK